MAQENNDLQAELAATRAELEAARAALKSGGPAPIPGSYKGHSFVPGHRRVRNAAGDFCDTAMLLSAANDPAAEGHDAAVEVLDRLIKMKYAYFTTEAPAPAKKTK